MSGSSISNKFPLFGWNKVELLDLKVANGDAIGNDAGLSMISPSVVRRPGLREGVVVLVIPFADWSAGGPPTNLVNVLLEGSNDNFSPTTSNDHWTIISELDVSDYFVSTVGVVGLGFVKLLGAIVGPDFTIGEGTVSFGRYRYLRVRAEIVPVSGGADPTFSMDVQLAGVATDSERFSREYVLTRVSGGSADVIAASTPFARPAGTRYVNIQTVVNAIQLDGGDGFSVFFEGSVDNDGPWFTLASSKNSGAGVGGFDTLNQSEFLGITTASGVTSTEDLIDMASFQWFRIRGDDGTGAFGGLQSYTMTNFVLFDGNDILDGEIPLSRLSDSIQDVFIRVHTEPNMRRTDTVSIGGVGATTSWQIQILDFNGRPLRVSRPIRVRLVDTATGLQVLNTDFEFSAITKGTQPLGGARDLGPAPGVGFGVNDMVFNTAVDGIGIVTVRVVTGGALGVVAVIDQYIPAQKVAIPIALNSAETVIGQIVIQADRAHYVST